MLKAKYLHRMFDAAKRDKTIDDPAGFMKEQIQFQLQEGLKPNEYGLRDLFVNLVQDGHEMLGDWEQRSGSGMQVTESASAVTTADFALIAEQLAFTTVMDAYKLASLVGDQLVSPFPSSIQESEEIPGIAVTADAYATPIPQSKPYPLVGMQPSVVRIPAAEKRGGIIAITREMVIRDRTGLLLQRAADQGTGMGLNKEKRIIDTVIGADASYNRKNEARATYANSAAGSNMGFDNLATEILTDFTDIRLLDEQFNAISDPDINEPLDTVPTTIFCGRDLSWQARSIVRNVQVRQGDTTAAPAIQGVNEGNRLPFDLQILSSEHLIRRLIARSGEGGLTSGTRALANAHWFFGNFKKAFIYKEIWALTNEQAPPNDEAQFTSDIWHRFKVSENGVPAVREPRLALRSGGTVAS